MTEISGIVIEGKKEGGRLGYPTANIIVAGEGLEGVYSGWIVIDSKEYLAALFAKNGRNIIEAHVLNFEGDLYGKEVKIKIGKWIRDTVSYESDEQMKKLIEQDIKIIKELEK